ncbi:MAG: type II toxin-antitoxin system VapC family toxin [Dehalococcoidia bacterium]|nr:type II toxin-antitoxin system VapC family toxin [Dehalococcoidia bacterium]
MTVYYVESSALLKMYKSEKGSEVVKELFDGRVSGELLVTSYLSVLEVNSVAARLLKGGAIKTRQYETMVGTFVQDLSTYGVVVLPVHNTLVQEAIELLPRCPLRTADALQFAAAMRASRAVGEQPFRMVSADKEIGEACAS